MAAVLKYGSKPTQPVATYPFLTIGYSGYIAAEMRPDQMQTSSLEGTYDRLQDNPFTKSKIAALNPSKYPRPLSEAAQIQAPPTSHINNHINDNTPRADIDPNLGRRKRRKLTPTEQAEVTDTTTQAYQNDQEKLDDKPSGDDPIDAGADGHNISTQQVSTSQKGLKGGPSSSSQSVSKTPKRGRPRKQEAQSPPTETGHTTGQEVMLESNMHLIPPEINRLTPTKTPLSLHANGKLISSPTSRSPRTRKLRITNDKKAASTRNFKMKDGKFVQSLEIVLRYGHDEENRRQIGGRIDSVLSKTNDTVLQINTKEKAITHPFFLGKVKANPQTDEQRQAAGNVTDCESESSSRRKEPVAWKDIKFTSHKPAVFKSTESLRPIWPPLPLQHIGMETTNWAQAVNPREAMSNAKLKTRLVQLPETENILLQYVRELKETAPVGRDIHIPEKIYASGAEVASKLSPLSDAISQHDAIKTVSSALKFGTSAFDRGECAGPNIWPLQYAPSRWSEVLQPSVHILHQWLQGLAIHNVKSGIDTKENGKKLKGPAKKKRRKLKDELDDFIVNSDDDDRVGKDTKNAILITGPHGCGKTASVYAIAKELGVEVFEIHPGMRRSAKDIFDKVGDMAHNHLVQRGPDLSRNSSVAPSEGDITVDTDTESRQASARSLLQAKAAAASKTADNIEANRITKAKREQKQSLILFEEVDLLFDDDKGFWNGVQSLISHSKRPVVLTCNDVSSIPVDDLDLYDVLHFEPVETELATDYLLYLAAAEGHIIDRKALSTLYSSKSNDLRASITELNLWCQMTVGSNQGGLDWMAHTVANGIRMDDNGKRLRVFSKATYHESLHLMPQIMTDNEEAIRFNQDSLGIAASDWCDFESAIGHAGFRGCSTNLQALSQISDINEARSVLDLLDDGASPALAFAAATLCSSTKSASNRHDVASRCYQHSRGATMQRKKILQALEPIMVEKPTFPPSLGRLAPSLDAATSSIATEIAPYIRHIVKLDIRLEQHRDEVFGSQGKARKTRAARAAAEGGDKASTRSERWFPKNLDFNMVLATAGDWPEWYDEQQRILQEVNMASPSTSSDV